ncbi:MAG: DUF4158 domain-containing protein, partial [Desulfobacterales bacterium]|nr:DUF4158 domain-containing protein [Desulfobacterales bacterium]
MTTHISILNKVDKKAFESPPVFSDEDRCFAFDIPQWAYNILDTLRTPINKIGFILQLGYFKFANKFFNVKKFYQNDIEFVANMLGFSKSEISLNNYSETTYDRHRTIILKNFGFTKFDQDTKNIVEKEAEILGKKQMRPRFMFLSLVNFLKLKKIEVPTFNALAEIITNALKSAEKDLYKKIELHLTIKQKQLLDKLININISEDQGDVKINRYNITLLKNSNNSTRPAKIRENIKDLICLKELFNVLQSTINILNLEPEVIQFYARIAYKSQVFQLYRQNDSKYLYLLTFVINQYYVLNDILVDTILQSVQMNINTTYRDQKDQIFQTRISKQLAIKELSKKLGIHLAKLKEVERIVNAENINDTEKVKSIKSLFKHEDHEQIENIIKSIEEETDRVIKDSYYYDILEKNSIRL